MKTIGNDHERCALPWRTGEFPTTVSCRALLYPDEIAYLHWVGSKAGVQGGSIIDLGAFLGGSSLALAQGSAQHECDAPWIYAYDLFRVTQTQRALQSVPGSVGDSYLDQYKGSLHEHMNRITTYEGFIPQWIEEPEQLRGVYPSGDPISVLFIDCAKQWGVHHTILRAFGPYLKAGSILVQQDFRGGLVYLSLHMYQLRAVLIPTHFPDGGTVGFIAKGPVEQTLLEGLWTREDIDRIGHFSVLKEVADWFDSLGFDPVSPWVWLAGIREFAQDAQLGFFEESVKNASAGLRALRDGQMDIEKKKLRREHWNGEVRRVATLLQDESSSYGSSSGLIAQRILDELLWDGQAHPVGGAGFDVLWEKIEQECLKHGWIRIALYCSGRHSSDLLASGWPRDPRLQVVAILDDASGKDGYSIDGIPVIAPSKVEEFMPDVIIPSSDMYEAIVYPSCQSVAQRINARVIRVYSVEE